MSLGGKQRRAVGNSHRRGWTELIILIEKLRLQNRKDLKIMA
jgi:hypothetical protein